MPFVDMRHLVLRADREIRYTYIRGADRGGTPSVRSVTAMGPRLPRCARDGGAT